MDLNLPEQRVFVGPARLWKRLLCFIVDLSILDLFVYTFFSDAAAKIIGNNPGFSSTYRLISEIPSKTNSLVLLFTTIIFLTLAYFVLLQYTTGQTVGCILLRMKVVSQAEGNRHGIPAFWQCLLRNLFVIPAVPFIFLWAIDPLYMLFTKGDQRLTEFISKTIVIEEFT